MKALFERTSLKLGCNVQYDKSKIRFSEPDIYVLFEKGVRGGVSYISNRYSKANNKYLKSYDPKQESKYIIYLDTDNLYGYAMSNFFPTSGFKWKILESFT